MEGSIAQRFARQPDQLPRVHTSAAPQKHPIQASAVHMLAAFAT